ncbi:MAG: fibro-slime domain-containing protein, partial [Fibromonadaceae bacterium]|nr:fibro-slime domain-containing protein [Fibromonadaceae bacterium]
DFGSLTGSSYNLAAFIYDTDPSVHPDFSCGLYRDEENCREEPAVRNDKSRCLGVRKGLVKPTLNPVTKKIEYSGVDPRGCWTSEEWFNKAFTYTPGVNVMHCFDLPFNQEANGRFEFDSDKYRNANGELIGGFFPEMLHNAPTDPSCPSCNTKRTAEVFAPLISTISAEQFDSYISKEGNFADGDIPTAGTVLGTAVAGSVWNWTGRSDLTWYLHGTMPINGSETSKANQHFCFESHAEFIYQKGQVFDFRGDDAIWIYIDNRLVVDLGGAHLAAPGRVNLDTMDLNEGMVYPIDIFFCDLRTTMSNVRISTNMYITQNSSFYQSPDASKNTMCMATSGGNDCASKMGGGSTACGADLLKDYDLDFFMGTSDVIWLSPSKNPENCVGTASTFTCYGGIVIDNGTYSCGGSSQCKGNPTATSKVNFSGDANVYVRLIKNNKQVDKPIQIDEFKK